MTRPGKIALGIASLWPFVWFAIFMLSIFGMIFFTAQEGKSGGSAEMPWPFFLLFFPAHFFTIFFIFALMAFYVVYLFRTDRVPQDKKALWAVVIFFGNVFAFPVFWYLYVWPESGEQVPQPGG